MIKRSAFVIVLFCHNFAGFSYTITNIYILNKIFRFFNHYHQVIHNISTVSKTRLLHRNTNNTKIFSDIKTVVLKQVKTLRTRVHNLDLCSCAIETGKIVLLQIINNKYRIYCFAFYPRRWTGEANKFTETIIADSNAAENTGG